MGTYLIFSDDWGRHPSSAQHLTRCLLRENRHQILWVNTIGTRPPRFDRITFLRGLEKLKKWSGAKKSQHPEKTDGIQPIVLQPVMWPWFRTKLERKLNCQLMLRTIRPALDGLPEPIVGVSTLPITADFARISKSMGLVSRWTYYCVDDWSVWPGMDSRPLAEMERDFIQTADTLVAAGSALKQRLEAFGKPVALLTHGVDLDFWHTDDFPFEKPENSPVFTYWGLIDERMEVAYLEQLAKDLDLDGQGIIQLAGPCAAPEILERLRSIPRVKLLGPRPLAALPELARKSDVLLMPYCDSEVTRQIQPLKMTEYLATGKPVVMRRIPASEEWRDALDAVESASDFSRFARFRAFAGIPDSQRAARSRLQKESWAEKAAFLEKLTMNHES